MPRTESLFTEGLLANADEKKELGLSGKQYVCSLGAAAAVDKQFNGNLMKLLERYTVSKARYNNAFKDKVMVLSGPDKTDWGYACHIDVMSPLLYAHLKSFDKGGGLYLYCLISEVSSLTREPQSKHFYALNGGYGSITEICYGSYGVETAISHKVK